MGDQIQHTDDLHGMLPQEIVAEVVAIRAERDAAAARATALEAAGEAMAREIREHAPCDTRGVNEAECAWRALLGDETGEGA